MPELAASVSGSSEIGFGHPSESGHDHREIAERLAGPELEELAVAHDVAQRDHRGRGHGLAAGDACPAVRHHDTQRGGGVVGHRILRIPEGAIAEQKRGIGDLGRRALLLFVRRNLDHVHVEVLRRDATGVGHDEREVGVLRQQRGRLTRTLF